MRNRLSLILLAAASLSACSDKAADSDSIVVENASANGTPVQAAPAEAEGQAFVSAVLGSYRFEVESARLAAAKAQRPDVKQFAQQLLAAFEASAGGLKPFTGDTNSAPTTGPTHQSDLAILSSTQGAPLEKAYLDQRLPALTELLGLVRAYKNGGDNAQLKAWAERAQAMIADQLDKTQSLKAEVEAAANADS